MTTDFIPARDAGDFTKHVERALATASDLMKVVTDDLNGETRTALCDAFDGGSSVGLEFLIDARGVNDIYLVAIDKAGMRTALLSVMTIGRPPSRVAQ